MPSIHESMQIVENSIMELAIAPAQSPVKDEAVNRAIGLTMHAIKKARSLGMPDSHFIKAMKCLNDARLHAAKADFKSARFELKAAHDFISGPVA
jgi:hypothetical protein